MGKSFEDFGALESLASSIGIANRARQLLKDRLNPRDLESLASHDVFTAAERGEAWARDLLDETIDYLAIGIVSIIACFDPELIVLGGEIVRHAELIVDPILQRIRGALPVQPRLVVSSLGSLAVVMGAITNVLHNTADFYVVQKLS